VVVGWTRWAVAAVSVCDGSYNGRLQLDFLVSRSDEHFDVGRTAALRNRRPVTAAVRPCSCQQCTATYARCSRANVVQCSVAVTHTQTNTFLLQSLFVFIVSDIDEFQTVKVNCRSSTSWAASRDTSRGSWSRVDTFSIRPSELVLRHCFHCSPFGHC